MHLIFPNSICVPLCQCSVWVVSGPASSSDITVIDPARSNTVLDKFSLPPTAPALCICAVPPIGQCWYNGLTADIISHVFCLHLYYPLIPCSHFTGQHCSLNFFFDIIFLVLFCQVAPQELCGLELRKEGSACWISNSVKKVLLSVSKILVGKAFWPTVSPPRLSPIVPLSHSILVHSASVGRRHCRQSVFLSEGVYSLT